MKYNVELKNLVQNPRWIRVFNGRWIHWNNSTRSKWPFRNVWFKVQRSYFNLLRLPFFSNVFWIPILDYIEHDNGKSKNHGSDTLGCSFGAPGAKNPIKGKHDQVHHSLKNN